MAMCVRFSNNDILYNGALIHQRGLITQKEFLVHVTWLVLYLLPNQIGPANQAEKANP
jgi:hypothetical protein